MHQKFAFRCHFSKFPGAPTMVAPLHGGLCPPNPPGAPYKILDPPLNEPLSPLSSFPQSNLRKNLSKRPFNNNDGVEEAIKL